MDKAFRNISTVICLGFGLLLPSAVTKAQSLSEAMMIALSQYPSILAAQARVDAADYQIMAAQSGHFPQISWQGTNSAYSNVTPRPFEPNDTWIQSPAVSLNIWSGWRIQSQVDRARAVYDSRSHQKKITQDEVAFQVLQAYLDWVRTKQLVKLAQDNVDRHERLSADVTKIARVDQGRRIDVTQAAVRTENAKLTLEQIHSDHEIASQRLRRMLLGRLPQFPSGYEKINGVLPASREQALSMLADNHPVIAQQIAEIAAAQADVTRAQSGFSPTVDVSYQRQSAQGSGQGDYVTQLNVNIPIFDGGSAYGSTRSAYAELDAAKQGLTEARITLRESLMSAWSEYATAQQRVRLGERQVQNARELVLGYDKQFRVGRRSLLDLLTIQDNLFSYERSLTNSIFQTKVAKAKILAVLNRLTSSYKLGGHHEQDSASSSPASGASAKPIYRIKQ